MPLGLSVLTALALVQAQYSPETHLATVAERLATSRKKIMAVDDAGASATALGRWLGQMIGEERRNQQALTNFLRQAKGSDSLVALKAVRVSGLWQAYLASAVLALDADPESKDLRDVLDRRLTRLLPKSGS